MVSGETLQHERINGGAFVVGSDGVEIPHKLIPNLVKKVSEQAGLSLYGGAQYHRAMAEFCFVVGGIKCPPITWEVIVNACGVEDIHDGTNYSSFAKARDTFEPSLHQAVDAFAKGDYARANRLMEQAVQFVYIVSGYIKAIVFHFHMPLKLYVNFV
ncbi:ARP2/3 actin-organizing complex subunit Arc5 [Stylosanthes scabra]|uniref:ARP2/3 actin-organizing complex subunit Arc5 n=1 Tax=Stylosanthes scabra TaxID=79078 RepID=A0ABU6S4I8_9FABA|nr:ARP2/3 actin-organizing complex subunit Arc5 [Stylosanthes scabra]